MPQHEYKPGDQVRYTGSSRLPHGSIGTVEKFDASYQMYVIAWDDFADGHDGDMGDISRRDYWFTTFSHLEPAP